MAESSPPCTPEHDAHMWIDPDPVHANGVLLSDRIRFYAERVNLIEPFQPDHLAPASYDLSVGHVCWYAAYSRGHGARMRILDPEELLRIPPNSIVFVTTMEVLNLPFYLIGRFNLKLRLAHEGLLVGMGPQIDPGFCGPLSCPLHNISDQTVSLKPGQRFAIVEFQKTTPFAQNENFSERATKFRSIKKVRTIGETGGLRGLNNLACLTFPSRALDRKPIEDYLPRGKSVSSSVEQIANDVKKVRQQFDALGNRVNVAALITVAAVAISFGVYFWAALNWESRVADVANNAQTQSSRVEEQLIRLESELSSSAADYRGELERRIRELIAQNENFTNRLEELEKDLLETRDPSDGPGSGDLAPAQ